MGLGRCWMDVLVELVGSWRGSCLVERNYMIREDRRGSEVLHWWEVLEYRCGSLSLTVRLYRRRGVTFDNTSRRLEACIVNFVVREWSRKDDRWKIARSLLTTPFIITDGRAQETRVFYADHAPIREKRIPDSRGYFISPASVRTSLLHFPIAFTNSKRYRSWRKIERCSSW